MVGDGIKNGTNHLPSNPVSCLHLFNVTMSEIVGLYLKRQSFPHLASFLLLIKETVPTCPLVVFVIFQEGMHRALMNDRPGFATLTFKRTNMSIRSQKTCRTRTLECSPTEIPEQSFDPRRSRRLNSNVYSRPYQSSGG